MFSSISRWFVGHYLRPEPGSDGSYVPSDAHILKIINSRVDRKRYKYTEVVELDGFIVPVLRHTIATQLHSVDLVHISNRGDITELDCVTMVEDQLAQYLSSATLKKCNERTKEES